MFDEESGSSLAPPVCDSYSASRYLTADRSISVVFKTDSSVECGGFTLEVYAQPGVEIIVVYIGLL